MSISIRLTEFCFLKASTLLLAYRVLLDYKKIPYHTEWINFEDIERISKQIGASAAATTKDGSPRYTVPFIKVTSKTGEITAVSDSLKIAAYIERTFPDSERVLMPVGTNAFHAAFYHFFSEKVIKALGPVLVGPYVDNLVSPEWYARTREKVYGKPVAEVIAKEDEIENAWRNVEAGFDAIAILLDANIVGDETPEEAQKKMAAVMGDRPSFADIQLVGLLHSIIMYTPEGWARLKRRNGGRWERLVNTYKEYLPPFQ